MKITNTQKVKLGLFVILSSLVLIISLYLIGKKQNLFGTTFKITAVFNNVNGLKLGNNVRYSGINVGTVKNIVMMNDSTICVDMVMDESIRSHMKQSATAVIGSDGLVGSMVVNIFPGGEGVPLKEGDTLKSLKKTTSTDMLSTLNVTNKNAAELSRDLLKITHAVNEGKGTLGLLLNDEKMGADVKATISNLKAVSMEASKVIGDIKVMVNEVNNEENLLHVLLKDSVSAVQFRSVINNLEKSSEEISFVISNLNKVILNVEQGEGAFNYMVSDTVLVEDISETVKNIKEGSVMLNENLEALRHNVLFRSYFKKLEKEQRKEVKKQNN